ncbi:hypothetical protein ABPG72_003087 [Tetrahymena utriculariae]
MFKLKRYNSLSKQRLSSSIFIPKLLSINIKFNKIHLSIPHFPIPNIFIAIDLTKQTNLSSEANEISTQKISSQLSSLQETSNPTIIQQFASSIKNSRVIHQFLNIF